MRNGRCRMHGGKSYWGVSSPTYKHGLYSRYLPTYLSAIYRLSPWLSQLLEYRPQREAVRVALAYRNEGEEVACRLLAELTIKDLVRRYGSIEAVEARFFPPLGPPRQEPIVEVKWLFGDEPGEEKQPDVTTQG